MSVQDSAVAAVNGGRRIPSPEMVQPIGLKLPNGRRRWLAGVPLAGGVLVALGSVIGSRVQQLDRQQHLSAETAALVRRDAEIKVSVAGSIKPLMPVNINPKAAGKVVALLVEQGDRPQTRHDRS